MDVLIDYLGLVVAGALGFWRGFKRGKKKAATTDSVLIQQMQNVKDQVHLTGIAQFGKDNPNQTDYEKGYLNCVDALDKIIEEETENILDHQ